MPKEFNGFTISREILDEDGNQVTSQTIKRGSAVLVRLSGTMQSGWDEVQAMIIDLLPAGFEIESTKNTDTIDFGPYDEAWEETEEQFVNARDDRCVAAPDLRGDDIFQAKYNARAVTRGIYVLPAPYIESMYRPDRFARGEVIKIKIDE